MRLSVRPGWLIPLGLLACVGAWGAPCDGDVQKVSSPGGGIEVSFCLSGGAPRYQVAHDGQTVLEWSGLGLVLRDAPALLDGFALAETRRRSHDETWEQVWGEDRWVRDRYNELRAVLVQGDGRRMDLVFRLHDDGLGFRYEIPEQAGLGELVIQDERTEFAFVADHDAWWIPAFVDNHYEHLFRKTPLSRMPSVQTPLTIEASGRVFALHEANLTEYASMALRSAGGGKLVSELTPWSDGSKVRSAAPMRSPWRALLIGRTVSDLAASHLVLNLNEPNRIADTSWIRPRKFLGIWWGMHLGQWTWEQGSRHGATTERARQYIDFAARLGIPGLLIEGWNQGWDGDWVNNGGRFRFSEPTPDFDLGAVAAYARERGVQLIGHHETAGAISNYESQMEDAFALYESLGVHAVKTGYVSNRVEGGEWHYGQYMARHLQRVTEAAARHRIMLDVHEPIKDTGLRRTYPNLMTREGARGGEYDAWGRENGNPPEYATVLPYTRSLAGPFDYTPGIFDLLRGSTPSDRVRTTLAKQLALYVTIYSPLHMAADLPENYEGHPAFQFIRDVPTDWERSIPLDGRIGDYSVFARKDRHSADWYVGAVTDENDRVIEIPLHYLAAGEHCATIYRDAPGAHYLDSPRAHEIVRQSVRNDGRLAARLAPGGGWAARVSNGSCPD